MKTVYLFTNTFPYGINSETFIEEEMRVAGNLGLHIVVLPLHRKKVCRCVPSNVEICNSLADTSFIKKIYIACLMLFSLHFWKMLWIKDRPRSPNEFYQGIKYLYGSFWISSFLSSHKYIFKQGSVFYSYWFNHTPLGLGWRIKKDEYYRDFVLYTRAHRYDVYDRQIGSYIPYRKEALAYLKGVFCVAKEGKIFLQKCYPNYAEKIFLSHLGVSTKEQYNKKVKKVADISFISCSSLTAVKRVDFIFKRINSFCVAHPQLCISWTHIGGGPLLRELQALIENKSKNLNVILTGYISNSDVKQLYMMNDFDLFVNMSLSEGIPVSIMEAISFGIPIIATNVGGNAEIVNDETGVLIPVNIDQAAFNETVSDIMNKMDILKISTILCYQNEFNADKNYHCFYNQITL